ncbi:hypothetical protein BTS2_2077 [Bacillus sp. TS-2]|nr:hypothetical protein BTS2_2077 [Bacillus sp. TS-2]
MSIRLKLIIYYVLMTIIPIGLFIIFLHLLFHLFLNNIEEMRDFYQVEDGAVEAFFYDELAAINELKQIALTDPNELLKKSLIEQYEAVLEHRQVKIIVRRDGHIVGSSSPEVSALLNQLPAHRLASNQESMNHQGHLGEGDQSWLFTGTDFYFDDDSEGSLYFAIDVEPVDSFLTNIIPIVVAGFIVAFLLTNALITYVISKHLIQPLKKLHVSAGEIAKGNLEKQTDIVRRDEIGDLARAFEEMRLQLKKSIEIQNKYEVNRKELINNISHDLKTPITSIKGHVQGIIDGVAKDQNKLEKYVQVIHVKASEMDQLVDELLLFSKLDLNSIPFHFEHVNVYDYMIDIADNFQDQYEDITFQKDLQINPKTHIHADRNQLYKVFSNLIANSIKFMNKENKKITLSASIKNEAVTISVSDNGQGIHQQDLPFIFDRFYRAEASRGSDQGGSGIGLAIVKQIIDAHQGSLGVESKMDKGTTIYFTIPLTATQDNRVMESKE